MNIEQSLWTAPEVRAPTVPWRLRRDRQGGGDPRTVAHGQFCSSFNGPSFATRTLRGFTLDTEILGIDVRPATGQLIGLGDAGGVYVIDPTPGTSGAVTLLSRLNVALDGSEVAIDFNPIVDRLRVVSELGQNLRINVDTGAHHMVRGTGAPGRARLRRWGCEGGRRGGCRGRRSAEGR